MINDDIEFLPQDSFFICMGDDGKPVFGRFERLALDISHIDKKIKAVNSLGKAMAASLLNFERVGV